MKSLPARTDITPLPPPPLGFQEHSSHQECPSPLYHMQCPQSRKPRGKTAKLSLLSSIPGKSAMKTTSVWLSRLLLISCNLVLQGDRSIKSGCSQGVRWKGDQAACTMSTRGSKILRKENHVLRRPQPPTYWNFWFCSVHHCSQREQGLQIEEMAYASMLLPFWGTERRGKRFWI